MESKNTPARRLRKAVKTEAKKEAKKEIKKEEKNIERRVLRAEGRVKGRKNKRPRNKRRKQSFRENESVRNIRNSSLDLSPMQAHIHRRLGLNSMGLVEKCMMHLAMPIPSMPALRFNTGVDSQAFANICLAQIYRPSWITTASGNKKTLRKIKVAPAREKAKNVKSGKQEIVPVTPTPSFKEVDVAALPDSDKFFCIRRHKECAFIIYDSNSSDSTYSYTHMWYNPSTGQLQNTYYYPGGDIGFNLNAPVALATSTYTPHGTALFAGSVTADTGHNSWFFSMNSSEIEIIISAATPAQVLDYRISRWWDGVFTEQFLGGSITADGTGDGVATVNITEIGYYAIFCVGPAATMNIRVNINGGADVYCHITSPELYENINLIERARLTALSLTYTNTAPVLNLSGAIILAQVTSTWTRYATSPYDSIAKVKNFRSMRAVNGCYAFLKPTNLAEFEWEDYFKTNDNGVLISSTYPIDNDEPVVVGDIKISTEEGREGLFVCSLWQEHLSDSKYSVTAPASIPRSDWEAAINRLASLDQFYENPSHIKEIGEAILSHAEKFAGLLRGGLKVYETVAPILAGLLA